jgi:hypothetical protein
MSGRSYDIGIVSKYSLGEYSVHIGKAKSDGKVQMLLNSGKISLQQLKEKLGPRVIIPAEFLTRTARTS